MQGPPSSGDCNDDQFLVRANEPLPVLCGNNSGQHLYVDVRGRSETNLNLLTMPILPKPVGVHNETDASRTIVEWLHEVSPDRGWKMLVTQLPCDCSHTSLSEPTAPTGCLQYYKGISGKISSFNYHGTVRNYEPCWNGTEESCGESGTVQTHPSSFSLSNSIQPAEFHYFSQPNIYSFLSILKSWSGHVDSAHRSP